VTAPATTRRGLLVLNEVTLAAITVVAVLGLARLFEDGSFLPKVAGSAVAAHLLAALCRRGGLHPVATAAVAVVGGALAITWVQLGDTTSAFLPTGETLDVAREQLREAWETFGQVVAPAPVLPGFVLAASAGVWIIAFIADAAAFQAHARLEAIVPGATLFIFGGALGTGEDRVALSGAFLAAVVLHWLSQRLLTKVSAPSWLAGASGGTAPSLLRAGVALAVVGVVAAVVIGPLLPGATADAVVPWRATDRDDPGSRVTISPLVDIRSRLVNQSNLEVFRVRADDRAYWRLTSLERFDGRIWSSNRQYRSADGTLPSAVDTSQAEVRRSRARFRIGALSSFWLPAPFRPVGIDGVDASYDADSNSLLTKEDTATGLEYLVVSALPQLSGAELQTVPPIAPRGLAEQYTALPADFSPAVQQLAGRIVSGARTQYTRARALQDFFRSGRFTYDLEIQPGHSGRDLEVFLFETRRGYCEQFAGAFAAMARAVGLPSRVAVGFTPGEIDQATGEYVVHGFNGHAWPEVYLDGFGWVAFEPTPGRGIPGGEGYTGVEEQQAVPENPTSATTVPPAPTTVPGEGPTTTLPADGAVAIPPTTETDDGSPWPRRILVAVLVLVAVPLLWAGVLALLRVVLRRRRRSAARTPGQRVLLAWDEATEALARAGASSRPWETPTEFATRVGGTTPVDASLLTGLAGLTTTATYAPAPVAEAAAERAADAAGRIEEQVDALLDRRARLRHLVDPRPLLPERSARVEVR
jgi:transglutaminase-like putative cysteine protease